MPPLAWPPPLDEMTPPHDELCPEGNTKTSCYLFVDLPDLASVGPRDNVVTPGTIVQRTKRARGALSNLLKLIMEGTWHMDS